MKNIPLVLTGLLIVIGCSTRQDSNKQPVNLAVIPDSLIECQESDQHVQDSSRINTPLFFNDSLRNLEDFTVHTNYFPFDSIINALINNENTLSSVKSGYSWEDYRGSYKVLTDTVSKATLYLFKHDGYEYNFGNNQYLFINDTLSMVRDYYSGIYDYPTDSSSASIKMAEKLFIFNPDQVMIKERNKIIRGDKNYTLSNIAFKDSVGNRNELLKIKSQEFKNKVDFATKLIEEQRLRAEENRIKMEKQNEIINNITRDQLSSVNESRRKSFDGLLSSRAMKAKRDYLLEGTKNSVTAYYQYKRIVMVIYQCVNSLNEITSTNAFYFDESNKCIYNTNWNIRDKISYTYDMHWGSLIKYDTNYNRMEIDSAEKQQIINSSRILLASMMQHFPSFHYSFHWD